MRKELRRQLLRRHAWRFLAWGQRQDGQRLIHFFEVHVPAGEAVLCGSEAGHDRRDGAGGRRRKDRSQAAEQVALQLRAGGMPGQRSQSEPIDQQQQDVAGTTQGARAECSQRRIAPIVAATGGRDALHQIDQAAACVVGKERRTHDQSFYAKQSPADRKPCRLACGAAAFASQEPPAGGSPIG